MKPRKLKTKLPGTAEEWLEYQEHREYWTPEARAIADKHLKNTSPVTAEDRQITKKIREHLLTSHWKKPPAS